MQILLIIALIWVMFKFPHLLLGFFVLGFIGGAIENRKKNIFAVILNIVLAILSIFAIVWLLS